MGISVESAVAVPNAPLPHKVLQSYRNAIKLCILGLNVGERDKSLRYTIQLKQKSVGKYFIPWFWIEISVAI